MSIRVRRPMVVVAAAVALGAGAGTAVLAARESGTDAAPLPSDQQVGAALAATGWGESVAAAHVVSSGTPATASLLLAASGDAGASAVAEWEAGVAASGASLDLPGLANVDLLLPRATGGSFVADSAGIDPSVARAMTGLSGGAAVAAAVRANAASAEVSVGSVKVAGPTNAVEIVATPATNERAFLDQAGVHVGALLRGVATPDRAYLVRIVSASGAPLLVLGANPALGGGGAGSGIAWQAPGVRSGAVWGNPVPTT